MERKVQCNFRLYRQSIDQIDALVESPPAWLEAVIPGPVNDRTDVIERLVFLATKHTDFGLPSDEGHHTKAASERSTARSQKPKAAKKR